VKHSKHDFLLLLVTISLIAGGATIWFNYQQSVAEKLINNNRSTPAETPGLIQEWQDNLSARAESDRVYKAYLEKQHNTPMPQPFPYGGDKSHQQPPSRVEVVPTDNGEILLVAPTPGRKDIRVRLTIESARELVDDLTRELKERKASKAKP
jgi:hypothetical protein